jgi:hypothetical protein
MSEMSEMSGSAAERTTTLEHPISEAWPERPAPKGQEWK